MLKIAICAAIALFFNYAAFAVSVNSNYFPFRFEKLLVYKKHILELESIKPKNLFNDFLSKHSPSISAKNTLINLENDTAPKISYNPSLNNLVTGVAINPLVPINSGGAVVPPTSSVGTQLIVPSNGSPFNQPYGMSFDSSGNLYVTNYYSGTIDVFDSQSNYLKSFTPKGTNPAGIVFDSSGKYYVLSRGSGFVYKYSTTGSLLATLKPGSFSGGAFNAAFAIAIDAADNLYVTDEYAGTSGIGTLTKFNTNGAILQTITANIYNPVGVAIDSGGNIFVLNRGYNTLQKYSSSGTFIESFATNLNGPFALTIDPFDNVYVSSFGNSQVYMFNPDGSLVTTINNLTNPRGMVVNNKGYLFISDYTNNTVTRYAPPGGFFINQALPPGLTLDNTKGVISGTPTTEFSSTSFTITAFGYGNTKSTTNITISSTAKYDWIGEVSSDFNLKDNWFSGIVPTAGKTVNIGVNYTFKNQPSFSTGTVYTANIAALNIGNNGGKAVIVDVGSSYTLNVTGDINKLSDTNSVLGYQTMLTGGGLLKAVNFNILANYGGAASAYSESVNSYVGTFRISGNINLVSKYSNYPNNAAFNIISGTVTLSGTIVTANDAGSTSSINLLPTSSATLQFLNVSPLSTLSSNGVNIIAVQNPGATVSYAGSAQTVYTDAPIAGLSGGMSYQNLKITGTGGKTLNSGNLNIAGDFINNLQNDATNYITLTGTVLNFNGNLPQNLTGGSGSGTVFNSVIFSGSGVKSMTSGLFNVAATGVLTLKNNAILVAGDNKSQPSILNSFLTLLSGPSGSAAIAPVPAGCSINGNVNVQRYITGGASNYRGYRLLSSAVNAGGSLTGVFSINYLKNSAYLTGTTGTAGGFDGGVNPTLYLFRENLMPSNSSFTSGNFRGINNLKNSPNYSLDGETGTYQIPLGNGYLFFYRGSRTTAAYATETTPGYLPTADTLTATGFINQGQVVVKDWYTASSSNLGFTNVSGSKNIQGFNLVGNPYAGSVDWDKLDTTSVNTNDIYGYHLSGLYNAFIYILDPVSKNYNVYQAHTNGIGTIATTGSNIIPSGQGFFVVAADATARLTFNETAKINQQATKASGNLFLSVMHGNSDVSYLHLMIFKDSLNKDGILIKFNKNASDNQNFNEDAPYKTGNGSVSLTSQSADGISLAINTIPYPIKAKSITLIVGASTDGIFNLRMDDLNHFPDLFDVWLKDAYMRDSLDIKHNSTYIFNVVKADSNTYGANRFSLVIRQNPARALHLLSFIAKNVLKAIETDWIVENEANYTEFNVQKSTDGVNFFNIDTLTSNGGGNYHFTDPQPQNRSYYRLKLTGVTGEITYSDIIPVMYSNTNKVSNNIMVYPNPTNGPINIAVNQGNIATSGLPDKVTATTQVLAGSYDIKIFNMTGNALKIVTSAPAIWHDNMGSLLPGTYIIQVTDHGSGKIIGKSTFVKL